MNTPSSLRASSQPSPQSAPSKHKREINIHESIEILGREWRVYEPYAKQVDDPYEVAFLVEMELIDPKTSDHFEVRVIIHWEEIYDPTECATKDALFGIARTEIREHFTWHRYPPRFTTGGRYAIELRWPEKKEYDGTV